MAIDQQGSPPTPQIQAPRTAEQQVAGATSAHDVGYGRGSLCGHGCELRGLSYVPRLPPARGRFDRMFETLDMPEPSESGDEK